MAATDRSSAPSADAGHAARSCGPFRRTTPSPTSAPAEWILVSERPLPGEYLRALPPGIESARSARGAPPAGSPRIAAIASRSTSGASNGARPPATRAGPRPIRSTSPRPCKRVKMSSVQRSSTMGTATAPGPSASRAFCFGWRSRTKPAWLPLRKSSRILAWQALLCRAWTPGHYKRWFVRALQEEFDARRYPHGWTSPGFKTVMGRDWLPAMPLKGSPNQPALATTSFGDYAGMMSVHGLRRQRTAPAQRPPSAPGSRGARETARGIALDSSAAPGWKNTSECGTPMAFSKPIASPPPAAARAGAVRR